MQILRIRIHSTWIFTSICYGFIFGVLLAKFLTFSSISLCLVASVSILLSFLFPIRLNLMLAMFGSLALGIFWGSSGILDRQGYVEYFGSSVQVRGVVAEDVDISPSGGLQLRLSDIVIDGHEYSGQIWVSTKSVVDIRRSDTVTFIGPMSESFGSFAATIFDAQLVKVERPMPGDLALAVRDSFSEAMRQTVSEPGASLGLGFLVGQKTALPGDLAESLRIVGLTHIIVASGYNLTILVRIGRRLFARVSKYLATLVSMLLVSGFMSITGFSPSMSRAGIVASLSLWAWYYGRKFHPITLLGVAAAGTLIMNPSFIWGDVGWLLSFVAFAGVMIIAPIITAYFFGADHPPLVVQILIETIAATVATTPIIVMFFGQFSNLSLLANLVILPFIPFTMLACVIAGIGGYFDINTFGWLADRLLSGMISFVRWLSDIPGVYSEVSWGIWQLACYLMIIFGILFYMYKRSNFRLRSVNLVD